MITAKLHIFYPRAVSRLQIELRVKEGDTLASLEAEFAIPQDRTLAANHGEPVVLMSSKSLMQSTEPCKYRPGHK